METTIEISDSDTRSSMGQNATIVSKSSSNAELFVEDIKQQNITKQGDPKNDLSDVYGVKRMMRTPARAPKNDLTDVEGVKKMMKTPGRGPVNDLSDVEGVAALMQTPKRSTIPQVCITRPSCSGSLSTTNLNETFESPLNRTFEIDSTESIEKTFAGIVNSIDMPADQTIVLSEVGEEEMMTAEQQFDSLSGMSTSKTLDTDKDTCERVLDWIASTKDMLAKENNMDQILSNRYSNVTPNESFVGSGDAVSF